MISQHHSSYVEITYADQKNGNVLSASLSYWSLPGAVFAEDRFRECAVALAAAPVPGVTYQVRRGPCQL
jgi:hypothetical protein